ncbi:MAG: alpha-glucan family phosphorylase [Candidatus Daviesbacteria bacterium]
MGLTPETIQKTGHTFFDAIERPELKKIITPQSPWVLYTMEAYLQQQGFRGSGGLGILNGDMLLLAARLGIPMVGISPIYPTRVKQSLDENFYQQEVFDLDFPEEQGFAGLGNINIKANGGNVSLEVYRAKNVPLYSIYDPNFRYLYPGSTNADHRAYQAAALGFGGYQITKELDLDPAVVQLQESATTFAGLAYFDEYLKKGQSFDNALRLIKEKTVLSNHTLVQAQIACFTRDQFESFVLGNIDSKDLQDWVWYLMSPDYQDCNMSTLGMEVAGKLNGVSKLHAEIASTQFRKKDGNLANFQPITNGISLERWTDQELLSYYRFADIIDGFDLPTTDYQEKINDLDSVILRKMKNRTKLNLISYLKTRIDQYGNPIFIPENAKLACWTKRFAGYKRPGMIFEDRERLNWILEDENIHLLLAGKAHPEDHPMKYEIQRICQLIDRDKNLKKRVHFIQNYDEPLARFLVSGVDIWLNTPIVGQEACGTSFMKALANLTILISTNDGGVADVEDGNYFRVEGRDYSQEVESLYGQIEKAAKIVNGDCEKWGRSIKKQTADYFPTISGSGMMRNYIYFFFP